MYIHRWLLGPLCRSPFTYCSAFVPYLLVQINTVEITNLSIETYSFHLIQNFNQLRHTFCVDPKICWSFFRSQNFLRNSWRSSPKLSQVSCWCSCAKLKLILKLLGGKERLKVGFKYLKTRERKYIK